MASYDWGKENVVRWVREHVPRGSTCLDVGACDGKWRDLLGDWLRMDAVEIWEPNAQMCKLKYDRVFITDVADLKYYHYDFIIFGDVLEHMTIEKAQRVLAYADTHSDDYIVSLPFNYAQGAVHGNPYEIHIQADLNERVIAERYPQLELVYQASTDYAYYHRRKDDR